MFDEFREQVDETSFFEDDESEEELVDSKLASQRSSGKFLGMTPAQRFVIALMLLGMSCLLSTLCLLVTGRIALPV
jgi:hypothetical protein